MVKVNANSGSTVLESKQLKMGRAASWTPFMHCFDSFCPGSLMQAWSTPLPQGGSTLQAAGAGAWHKSHHHPLPAPHHLPGHSATPPPHLKQVWPRGLQPRLAPRNPTCRPAYLHAEHPLPILLLTWLY